MLESVGGTRAVFSAQTRGLVDCFQGDPRGFEIISNPVFPFSQADFDYWPR
jgi:hypothetical protein